MIEAGSWQIGDMQIEAGVDTVSIVNSSNNGWTGMTKNFTRHFTGDPIVLHQVMSNNDPKWITSWAARTGDRLNAPTYTSMQIGLNAAQVTPSDTHSAENVGWVAFTNIGAGTVGTENFRTFFQLELAIGHQDGCTTFTPGGTYSNPIPLISQLSMDGTDGSWASVCSLSTTTVGTHFEEDQYTDSERSHGDEAVGAIVFDGAFSYAGSTNPDNNTGGTYTSPVLGDSAAWRNFNVIDWLDDIDCTNCSVQIQVRTGDSVSAIGSATYLGPDGTADTYYDSSAGDLLSLEHLQQPYVQYQVTLHGSTVRSPIFYDATIWGYEQ